LKVYYRNKQALRGWSVRRFAHAVDDFVKPDFVKLRRGLGLVENLAVESERHRV
jgi:hypothetical protein